MISPSSERGVLKNFSLAGVLKNKFLTVITVPISPADSSISETSPPSTNILYAQSCSNVFETMLNFETDAILANASPLKPSVLIESRSFTVLILLVACGKIALDKSSFSIPEPLSIISINEIPPFSILISILVAFASIAFSTNSLTTENGRSTTSPAEILLKTLLVKRLILPIIILLLFLLNHSKQ